MFKANSQLKCFLVSLVLMATTACSSTSSNQTNDEPPQSDAQVQQSQQASTVAAPTKSLSECSTMSQQDCLNSGQCIVAKKVKGKGYMCRANTNRCETDFVQNTGKDSCATQKGCDYSPGSCFCPEGVQCICGGGHPPMCSDKSANRDNLQ